MAPTAGTISQSFSPANLITQESTGPVLNWPALISAIKAIITRYSHNELDNATRSTIKGWLKSDQCAVSLMGFSFIHTLSLNAGGPLRQQLAQPIWMERLEKLLAKPQHPLVGSACAQVLVDWAFLLRQDLLGMRANQLMCSSKHRQHFEGKKPSKAALEAADELALGLPAVGPRRGVDFLQLSSMASGNAGLPNYGLCFSAAATNSQYARSNSLSSNHSSSSIFPQDLSGPNALGTTSVGSTGGGSVKGGSSKNTSGSQFTVQAAAGADAGGGGGTTVPVSGAPLAGSQVQQLQQQQQAQARQLSPAAAQVLGNLNLQPPPMQIPPSMVPCLVTQMQQDITDLRRRTAVAREAACSMPRPTHPPRVMPSHIKACVDAGYLAAERCSGWRIRVKDLTQTMEDPCSLASLLHEVDQANAALEGWQYFASGGVLFQALGLPPNVSSRWRSQLRSQLQDHHQNYAQQQAAEMAAHAQRGCSGYQEATLVEVDDLVPSLSGTPPSPDLLSDGGLPPSAPSHPTTTRPPHAAAPPAPLTHWQAFSPGATTTTAPPSPFAPIPSAVSPRPPTQPRSTAPTAANSTVLSSTTTAPGSATAPTSLHSSLRSSAAFSGLATPTAASSYAHAPSVSTLDENPLASSAASNPFASEPAPPFTFTQPHVPPSPTPQPPPHRDPFADSLSGVNPFSDPLHTSSNPAYPSLGLAPPARAHAYPPPPIQAPTYNPFVQQDNQVPGATSPSASQLQSPASSTTTAPASATLRVPSTSVPTAHADSQKADPLNHAAIPPRSSSGSLTSKWGGTSSSGNLPLAARTGGNVSSSADAACGDVLSVGPFASKTGGSMSMQQQRQLQHQQQQQQQQQAAAAATARAGPYSQPNVAGAPMPQRPDANPAFARSYSATSKPAHNPSYAAWAHAQGRPGYVSGASSGVPGSSAGPDWQAELAQLLGPLQRPQADGSGPPVHPAAATQIEALFKRMQMHYEGTISMTKSHSVNVLKDMQQKMQQQQQQQQR